MAGKFRLMLHMTTQIVVVLMKVWNCWNTGQASFLFRLYNFNQTLWGVKSHNTVSVTPVAIYLVSPILLLLYFLRVVGYNSYKIIFLKNIIC